MNNETIIVTGEHNINMMRYITLSKALWLETKGLGRRGQSAGAIVKAEFGFKGNKLKLLKQLEDFIEANGHLMETRKTER